MLAHLHIQAAAEKHRHLPGAKQLQAQLIWSRECGHSCAKASDAASAAVTVRELFVFPCTALSVFIMCMLRWNSGAHQLNN